MLIKKKFFCSSEIVPEKKQFENRNAYTQAVAVRTRESERASRAPPRRHELSLPCVLGARNIFFLQQ